ncbi:hypothetical protein EDC94DRAFT_685195 [Helicostylum pulchrum]|nr:hypothetical protein EDC94DRAFT_685195 [Helicostylum pulchrum]
MSALSSLPPVETKYNNTWVTMMENTDGRRLVLGTKTLNALITSSLRIDSIKQASIDGMTSHFELDDSAALTTSVYLDNDSPYTVFTLCEAPDSGRDSATKVISKLFNKIANTIHSNTNPTLSKQYVNSLFATCPDGQMKLVIKQIVELYNEDEHTIVILENYSLNALLALLASSMSTSLVSANKSVAENVQSRVLNGQ